MAWVDDSANQSAATSMEAAGEVEGIQDSELIVWESHLAAPRGAEARREPGGHVVMSAEVVMFG